MANTATARTALPVKLYGATKVTIVKAVMDTADSDFTVYTLADATKFWALVGLQYAEATAHNLTIKSGANTLNTFEMAASSGRDDRIGNGIIAIGNVGENLVVQASAVISLAEYAVIEVSRLYF